MPVTTIDDLLEHGFDFEVEQFLAGNTRPGLTLEGLALRTFGEEWQGTPQTLLDFAQQVRASMNAADNLSDAGLTPGTAVPGANLTPGGPEFRTIGFAESSVEEPGEAVAPANAHVPFSIDQDTVPTPQEIVEMLDNDPSLAQGDGVSQSPGLRKRLQELAIERLAGVNRDWEVTVTRIWRNLRSRRS